MIPDDATQPLPRVPADSGGAGDAGDAGDATQLLPPVQLPPPVPPAGPGGPRWLNRQWLAIAGATAAALVLVAAPLVAIQLSSSASPAPAQAATSTAPQATGSPPGRASAPPAPDQDGKAMAPTPSAPPPRVRSTPQPESPAAPPSPTPAPPAGPWSTIVDNSSPGFTASGNWRTSTDSAQRYGPDFRYASPEELSDPAWYRVDIPEAGQYRVEAWFPAKSGYNERTPYIVATADGNQTIHISQQSGGGGWVSLGTFELAAGNADVVAVSRWRTAGTGYVIADAVRITRV